MRQGFWLLLTGLLAACNSPHPAFMGVQAQEVEVQGSTFQVRIKGDVAEVIRTNFEYVPKIGEIFPKAAAAIGIVSGCNVVPNSMKGDPALMTAKLNCGYD